MSTNKYVRNVIGEWHTLQNEMSCSITSIPKRYPFRADSNLSHEYVMYLVVIYSLRLRTDQESEELCLLDEELKLSYPTLAEAKSAVCTYLKKASEILSREYQEVTFSVFRRRCE